MLWACVYMVQKTFGQIHGKKLPKAIKNKNIPSWSERYFSSGLSELQVMRNQGGIHLRALLGLARAQESRLEKTLRAF